MPGLQVCCMLGNVAFWSSSERFFSSSKNTPADDASRQSD